MRQISTSLIGLAAGLSLLAVPALADKTGPYVKGTLGLTAPSNGGNGAFDTKNGIAGAIGAGYAYEGGLRAELELVHHDASTKSDSIFDGDVKSTAVMLNALYDIETDGGLMPGLMPYVGAGIGYAWNKTDVDNIITIAPTDEKNSGVAFQGIAGLAYHISDMVSANLEYRYYHGGSADINNVNGGDFLDYNYHDHAIMAGLTVYLGGQEKAPEPAPMPKAEPAPEPQPEPVYTPAPAPAPEPKTFVVYFNHDDASLTEYANRVIGAAADYAERFEPVTINLDGHTDTSGNIAYNKALSEKRAMAVYEGLVAEGVDPEDITLRWAGEDELLVPTEDDVKEGRNRRVEILVRG